MNCVRNNSMSIATKDVLKLLEAAPKLRSLLMRWARMAAKGEMLSATFSVSGLGYEDQQALERFLHVTTSRTRSGRVSGTVPEEMRDPAAWRTVLEALGLGENVAAESTEDFLTRIQWQMPEAREVIAEIMDMPEVQRHLADAASRPTWRGLFESAWNRARRKTGRATTLSQLGSDWFNDSKILRSGSLRRQLVLILSAISGVSADDERSVFAEAGIEENPYTSSVVVSAPFTFRLKDGTRFDYPMKFFMKRLVCQLPLETVREIDSIWWEGYDNLVTTCENAAPITGYVEDRSPVVYTEGYPNLAVQRLLKIFAQAGLKSVHMGDGDLDGFRIAATVDRCIPVERVGAVEVVADPKGQPGIPLSDAQVARIDRFLERHPDFKYAESVRLIRERGCWYEQEGFVR